MRRKKYSQEKNKKGEYTNTHFYVFQIYVCAFVTFAPLIEKEERKGHGRF